MPQAGYSAARPLQVELRYNSGDQHNRLAVAVAAMWKDALGVETTLYAEEFRALLQSIQARKDTQVFRSSWIGDFNDAYSFAQLLQSDFGINLTGYSNPRYDALLAEAVQQADLARRRALLEEAERVMLADHPVLPLYFYVNKHLVKPWVRGWTDNVMNVVYSKDLWLEPRTPEDCVTVCPCRGRPAVERGARACDDPGTGIIRRGTPMTWFVVFAISAFGLWFWRQYRMQQRDLESASSPQRMGERFIGQVVTVPKGIENGAGHVQLGRRNGRCGAPTSRPAAGPHHGRRRPGADRRPAVQPLIPRSRPRSRPRSWRGSLHRYSAK